MKKKTKQRIRKLEKRIAMLEKTPAPEPSTKIPNVQYVVDGEELNAQALWEKRAQQYNCAPSWEYNAYL